MDTYLRAKFYRRMAERISLAREMGVNARQAIIAGDIFDAEVFATAATRYANSFLDMEESFNANLRLEGENKGIF